MPKIIQEISDNKALRSVVVLPPDATACDVLICPNDFTLSCNAHITFAIFFSVLESITATTAISVQDLQAAWADVLKRATLVAHHKISREELSVREHMTGILRKLQSAKFIEFSDLFDPSKGAPVLVVNFVALLELAKETLIEITQAEAFAPIYVRLAYLPTHSPN